MTSGRSWCGLIFSVILMLAGCGGGSSASPSAGSSPQAQPASGGSFAALGTTPSMNQERQGATATLLPNGNVLIAGGFGRTSLSPFFGTYLDSVELYGSASNSFAPPASTPTMNTARYQAAAVLLPNGKVLIAGGEALGGGRSRTAKQHRVV